MDVLILVVGVDGVVVVVGEVDQDQLADLSSFYLTLIYFSEL